MITGEERGLLLYGDDNVCNTDTDNHVTSEAADRVCQDMGFHSALVWGDGSCTYGSSPYCMKCNFFSCRKCYASERCGSNQCVYLSCRLSCLPGMYLTYNKMCVYCPVNTFKATKGRQTSCTKCPHGATSVRGSSDYLDCVCDIGRYLNTSDSRKSCLKCRSHTACQCPAGSIWIMASGSEPGYCKPCQPGRYRPETETSCRNCLAGSTSTSGSDHCVCKAGMFLNGGSCEQCPEGTISQQGSSTCVECPSQSDHEGTSCACPAGETWNWDNSTSGSCRPCSAGTYSNLTATCTICPSGTTSLVGADHCLCPAGKFWSKDNSVCKDCEERTIQNESLCKPCSKGFISQEGATTCVECPSQSDHEGTSCACPAGETWSWDNSTSGSCRPCSAGTYSNLTATCTIMPIRNDIFGRGGLLSLSCWKVLVQRQLSL